MSGENSRYIVQVYVGALSLHYEALSVEASKQTTSEEIVLCIFERLALKDSPSCYELAEVVGDRSGVECKERRLGATESPVKLMLLWPQLREAQNEFYRFYLREKLTDTSWGEQFSMDTSVIKDYLRQLYQPKDREYPDLCQLPDLNEQTLLDNLRARFVGGYIYTYVGSILIALNPFKFYPIYNPKYVKMYQNRRLGGELPPHIFAVADAAYHSMLKERRNQCIVISGESGSGKTESTNFLLHHLTALSQKGSHGCGVEQTILSAGPVLEAFGNAKTAHNNNSSRFGKFIQVNYKENGMVHGAVVQKYLLEKSRICSQGRNERNYHVFYYLLTGASEADRKLLHLCKIQDYEYLNKSGCFTLDNVDEKYEFSRLKQSMEMVGFNTDKQRRLFSVLSAVLLLGNVEFRPRKSTYHHDEAVAVSNPEVVGLISELLSVKQETLLAALTAKRARASGETLVINYRRPEAVAARDAMAKCLYGALFDWIVLQLNHALLYKKDTTRLHQGHSIGVLDIFGFEDLGNANSFEQLCINYANEHLQFYFNQHVFKYEQEEYRKETIRWNNIDFMDNTGCLYLIEGKPFGLFCVLDDQCNFPGATNETLVHKFNTVHKENAFYEAPQRREAAFFIRHYAGRVKYQMSEMREKNLDLMRQDIVGVLKNSNMAFVRELVGADPVAVFRWAIVRAFFRGYFAFHEAGRRHRQGRAEGNKTTLLQQRFRHHTPNDSLIRKNKSFRPRERGKKGLKNLQSVKTLAGRTQSFGNVTVGKRKQPLTVTAQFQLSLHSLMDTLNVANPFFIRCIKSNGQKIPNTFDEETVQRQLRYTGMLETVRIRQAGYNVRLTYDEFIQLYRILLPKSLLSSQTDVKNFMSTFNLNRDNYQLGLTKIFLRENEKTQLDYRLHQQIMAAIVAIQRWFRACLERRRFQRWRTAAVTVQSFWRCVLAQKLTAQLREQVHAAVLIQASVRGYLTRRWHRGLLDSATRFQACCRGLLTRRKFTGMRRESQDRRKADSEEVLEVVRPPRLGQEPRAAIMVGDPNEGVTSPRRRLVRRDPAVRKGSCDSLTSAREDSGLKEKAKKQFQSLLKSGAGGKGKTDKWSLYLAYSDGELDEGKTDLDMDWLAEQVNGEQPTAPVTSIDVAGEFYKTDITIKHDAESDKVDSLDRVDRVAVKVTRKDYRKQQSLSDDGEVLHGRKNALRRTPLDPSAPTRIARKQRRSPKTEEAEPDQTEWPYRHEPVYQRTASDPSTRKSDPTAQTLSLDNRLPLHLDRRNSDIDHHQHTGGELIEYKGRTMFTISGHRFRKVSKFSKQDRCVFCDSAMDPFHTQGHKCSDCKQLFHTKCIQNGGVLQMPCQRKNRKPRPPQEAKPPSSSKFALTGTSEFTDSTDKIISDVKELQKMQDFITNKIYKMETQEDKSKKPSEVDRVFKQALREFKDNLIATYSVANRQGDSLNIKYKDLITNFVHVMKTVCNSDLTREDFSVTMGVNAFRGFMNEFMAQARLEPEKADKVKSASSQSKRKKEKKRPKNEDTTSYNGHVFVLTIINIPTACEMCSGFFMWPIERSLVCQNCKLTCHKKCYQRTTPCRLLEIDTGGANKEHRVFGVALHKLAPDGKVPPLVDRLITTIEMYGLYTEGIYRKPGVNHKVKELKARMDDGQSESIFFDKYPVHVLASVLKSFLREMPEPLLTFDCYEDFLRAADLTDHHDRVSTLFTILNKLPKPNFHLMERLVFHLARVASQEDSNRMNPSSLAIVFAPCVLRTNKHIPAQDSLHDIAQQTQCIETIISDQLKKVKSTLADIDTLDTACHTATYRLSSLRSSKIFNPEEFISSAHHAVETVDQSEDEEALLVGHIHEIQKEKEMLTSTLPSLTRTTSDDDLLSTDMDDGSLDDVMQQSGLRTGQEDSVMV